MITKIKDIFYKLKEIEIINFLKINNLKTFDLAIFDRVLYMISEVKIKLFSQIL